MGLCAQGNAVWPTSFHFIGSALAIGRDRGCNGGARVEFNSLWVHYYASLCRQSQELKVNEQSSCPSALTLVLGTTFWSSSREASAGSSLQPLICIYIYKLYIYIFSLTQVNPPEKPAVGFLSGRD